MSRTWHGETAHLITFRDFLKLHYFQDSPARPHGLSEECGRDAKDFWDVLCVIPETLLCERNTPSLHERKAQHCWESSWQFSKGENSLM